MGGAIVAHAAARGIFQRLAGLVVIDVVEGGYFAMQRSKIMKAKELQFKH